jgi:hypothetical protein
MWMLLTKRMTTVRGTQALFLYLEKVPPMSLSNKQKIPSKSSSERKIIALYDKSSDILWTHQFLEAQGYDISTNVVFQDNMST